MQILLLFSVVGVSLTMSGVSAETSYTCDFERDTCGFTNEEGHVANWDRRELKLGGRKGYVMTVETNETETHMSRMSTPYFEIHDEQPGCLTFDFYTSGQGIKSLSVEQEYNNGITTIFLNRNKKAGWQKPEIDVDIDASTRFFFTATLSPSLGESVVAVTNMKLKLSKC